MLRTSHSTFTMITLKLLPRVWGIKSLYCPLLTKGGGCSSSPSFNALTFNAQPPSLLGLSKLVGTWFVLLFKFKVSKPLGLVVTFLC